jgi:hypothetical protein
MSAIVGVGLMSPRGLDASEHAFAIRADVRVPVPPAFLHGDEKMRVAYCPWLGARMPLEERIASLAARAAGEALLGLDAPRLEAIACVSAPRPDLPSAASERAVARALEERGARPSFVTGPAAFFQALSAAEARLAQGAAAVLLLAVDSFVSVESLSEIVRRPPSPWAKLPPRPSEAAAAIVVMDERKARARGGGALATIEHASVRMGEAHDGNDVPADGAAMTALIQGTSGARIAAVYGQQGVDSLRAAEWQLASVRARERFVATHASVTFEAHAGAVGAAAGAAGLALGVAAARHRALARKEDPEGLVLAWAISGDGLRGLAAVAPQRRDA